MIVSTEIVQWWLVLVSRNCRHLIELPGLKIYVFHFNNVTPSYGRWSPANMEGLAVFHGDRERHSGRARPHRHPPSNSPTRLTEDYPALRLE